MLDAWFAFGEDAEVLGAGDAAWVSRSELKDFADTPVRDAEDRNWRVLDPRRDEDDEGPARRVDGEEGEGPARRRNVRNQGSRVGEEVERTVFGEDPGGLGLPSLVDHGPGCGPAIREGGKSRAGPWNVRAWLPWACACCPCRAGPRGRTWR